MLHSMQLILSTNKGCAESDHLQAYMHVSYIQIEFVYESFNKQILIRQLK